MKHEKTYDLIYSLTDYNASRGMRLSVTEYSSFTKSQGTDSIEVETNVVTSSKPCMHCVVKYINKRCINTNPGSDDAKRFQLFCTYCGEKLTRSRRVTAKLEQLPS